MPSGGGSVTLEFKIFQKGNQGAGNITDCTVVATKKLLPASVFVEIFITPIKGVRKCLFIAEKREV
ncbi:hypothetical protein ACLB1O_18055 [Escherichia coli]